MGFLDRLLDALSADEPEETEASDQFASRSYTNHAGGYFVCSHTGCSKKVDESITGHDCCGRCRQGGDCRQTAAATYGGPGTFFHKYWETALEADVCATCGEPPELH